MIHSMTAFAYAEKNEGTLSVTVEMRAYNSRNLDIALHLQYGYMALEDKIKNFIRNGLTRGRIEIRISIEDQSEENCAFEVDEIKAAAYYKALIQLKDLLKIETAVPLETLIRMNGVIVPADPEKNMEKIWPVMQACLDATLADLKSMRAKEGDFIGKDLLWRLEYIERNIKQIREESADLLPHYRDRLKERMTVLTDGIVELDPERVAQEAAFWADKSDITEETVRANSHIQQFRTIIDSDEPAGRKLNFLLQELNREINTIGSKTGKTEVAHRVVEVKTELEKIREQVQNIE